MSILQIFGYVIFGGLILANIMFIYIVIKTFQQPNERGGFLQIKRKYGTPVMLLILVPFDVFMVLALKLFLR